MATGNSPAPWRSNIARRSDDGIVVAHVVDANGGNVAQVAIYELHETINTEANASLLAAAPELLSALKMARECIAYCRRAHKDAQSGEGFPVEIILDATIAKAEGRGTEQQAAA